MIITRALGLLKVARNKKALNIFRTRHNFNDNHSNHHFGEQSMKWQSIVSSPAGTIYPEPKKIPGASFTVFLCCGAGLILGTTIAILGANFLEKTELYIAANDDDDDDD